MTWSPLVTSISETTDRSARTQSVKGVVLHHAATTSLSSILSLFQPGGRTVSAHLAVKDAQRVGAVPEQFRAWSLGSLCWDSWSMTVECANESAPGWTVSAASHESLAQLVADWARRYNFTPHRSGNPKTWTVLGHREVYTIHGDSYATACPGGMDLDFIVKRAQQLLGSKPASGETAPTINSDESENTMDIRYLYTKDAGDGAVAYGIFGEQVPGGSRITRSVNTAEVWGAIWGTEDGAPWKEMTKAQWPRLIAEARVINKDWVAQQRSIQSNVATTLDITALAKAVNDDAAKRLAQ